jgi:hypothetical protein
MRPSVQKARRKLQAAQRRLYLANRVLANLPVPVRATRPKVKVVTREDVRIEEHVEAVDLRPLAASHRIAIAACDPGLVKAGSWVTITPEEGSAHIARYNYWAALHVEDPESSSSSSSSS